MLTTNNNRVIGKCRGIYVLTYHIKIKIYEVITD
jgi:hypothetical protein